MKKRLRFTIVLLLTCFGQFVFGQSITVLDGVTQQRIPGAKIYSNSPKVQKRANTDGLFSLEDFIGCDSIYISYPSYETKGHTFSEVKNMGAIELFDVLAFKEMSATANRWEQKRKEVANTVLSLGLKDMEMLGSQTSADLLEQSGYVFIQKSQLAGGSPQLRGFGTNRVMIVVDGVRMNNAIFRSGNLQNVISLDGNSLGAVEVLFGPGAVMYGSDAIGGVMNFSTKKGTFSPDSLEKYTRTNVFSRYSTASNEITGHFDFNLGTRKWAFLTAATYSRFGDLKVGTFGPEEFLRPSYQTVIDGIDSTVVNLDSKLQVGSGYSQLNLIQKIQFKPNECWSFDYGFNFSTTSNAPRYDRLILDQDDDGVLDNAQWYYGPQQWMMHRFSFLHTSKTALLYDKIRLTLAYQQFKESRHDRKTGSSLIRRQFEQVDAFSANLDLNKQLSHRWKLLYGLEGVVNRVGSKAYREPTGGGDQVDINSRYPDGALWQTYGLYASVLWDLTEDLNLSVGGRYTMYRIETEFDTTLFTYPIASALLTNDALNGNIGLTYRPGKKTQIYANASTGFRAPNVDDIGKVFDSEPGSVVVPNVDLKPEYAYSAELGFVQSIKSNVWFHAVGYYTYLKDALSRSSYTFNGLDSIVYEGVLSEVQAVQNISNAYVYGMQAGVELAFGKGFSVYSSISYQKGFDYNIDSAAYFPKSHITPLFGRTSFRYKRKRFRVEFYAMYHGRMDFEDFPLTEQGDHIYAVDSNGETYTPAWYTLNIKGSFFFNKHLSVTGGVENITDQLYRTFGSGISAPGRNFMISLKGTF